MPRGLDNAQVSLAHSNEFIEFSHSAPFVALLKSLALNSSASPYGRNLGPKGESGSIIAGQGG